MVSDSLAGIIMQSLPSSVVCCGVVCWVHSHANPVRARV